MSLRPALRRFKSHVHYFSSSKFPSASSLSFFNSSIKKIMEKTKIKENNRNYNNQCRFDHFDGITDAAGLPHGKGTKFYADGSKFFGFFMHGTRNGIGVEYFPDGRRYEGKWFAVTLQSGVTVSYPRGTGYLFLQNNSRIKIFWADNTNEVAVLNTDTTDKDFRNFKLVGTVFYNDNKKVFGTIVLSHLEKSLNESGSRIDVIENSNKVSDGKMGELLPPSFGDKDVKSGVTVHLDNMGLYSGDLMDGKPNNFGVLTSDTTIYRGNWNKGVKMGIGKELFFDGKIYDGYFENNLFHGFGYMKYPDGSEFRGNWINGARQGDGTEIFKDNRTYSGSWKIFKNIHKISIGIPVGSGIELLSTGEQISVTWDDDYNAALLNSFTEYPSLCDGSSMKLRATKLYISGVSYVGEVVNLNQHGNGVELDKDKQILFEGEWAFGKKHGKGKGNFGTNTLYSGEWYKNFWVNGVAIYENGSQYTGSLLNKKYHGFGKYESPTLLYEGNYLHGIIEGSGYKLFKSSNSEYRGQFKNNAFHGKGVFIRNRKYNSYIYSGDFENGLFHGNGVIKYDDGTSYEGDFLFNKKEGKGKFTFENGGNYVGEWKNDKPNGLGVEYDLDGTKMYEGFWCEGKRDNSSNSILTRLKNYIFKLNSTFRRKI